MPLALHPTLRRIHKRTLTRVLGTLTHVRTNEPIVALTFDDGPNSYYTPLLLDLLAQYDAKATFFMIGEVANSHEDVVREVIRQGHTVGNHSWSHPSFIEIGRRERWVEVTQCAEALGIDKIRLFRPPYGHQNFVSRLDLFCLRYQVVGWNVTPEDWLEQTSEQMARVLVERIRPGSIVLLHEAIYKSRLASSPHDRRPMFEALNITLATLSQKFSFVTIPELLSRGDPAYRYWTMAN